MGKLWKLTMFNGKTHHQLANLAIFNSKLLVITRLGTRQTWQSHDFCSSLSPQFQLLWRGDLGSRFWRCSKENPSKSSAGAQVKQPIWPLGFAIHQPKSNSWYNVGPQISWFITGWILWFMVLITIVSWVYKPTSNWGGAHIVVQPMFFGNPLGGLEVPAKKKWDGWDFLKRNSGAKHWISQVKWAKTTKTITQMWRSSHSLGIRNDGLTASFSVGFLPTYHLKSWLQTILGQWSTSREVWKPWDLDGIWMQADALQSGPSSLWWISVIYL